MRAHKSLPCGVLAIALAFGVTAPVGATTLVHAGLADLTASNDTIIVGEVLAIDSYWNEGGTFILTDVRVAVNDVLKGLGRRELTLTLLGGTVGDLTTLIIAGAELRLGNSYMLFLGERDLPGVRGKALTVPDHCQGVFDLLPSGEGLRAVSQAVRHPLLPGRDGMTEPPGGAEGLALEDLTRAVRAFARTGKEVR